VGKVLRDEVVFFEFHDRAFESLADFYFFVVELHDEFFYLPHENIVELVLD
jgi:hypothetical protein